MVLAFVGNTVLLLPGVPSLLGIYLLFDSDVGLYLTCRLVSHLAEN